MSGDDGASVDHDDLTGGEAGLHEVEICLGDVLRLADTACGEFGGGVGVHLLALILGDFGPERRPDHSGADGVDADVLVPEHLRALLLYREQWSCVVAKESRLPGRLTLKRYLEAEHIVVLVLDGVQSIPDKRLAALGKRRRWSVRMPYFEAALECIPRTELVLTATSGVAKVATARRELRVIEAPPEITGFGFQAVWHPRLDSDPAHTWLREQMVRLAGDL